MNCYKITDIFLYIALFSEVQSDKWPHFFIHCESGNLLQCLPQFFQFSLVFLYILFIVVSNLVFFSSKFSVFINHGPQSFLPCFYGLAVFLTFFMGGGVTLSGVALCVYIHILVISKTPLLTKASLVIPQEHQRRRRRCRAGERLKVR